jgi:hypothetical protein
MKLEHFNLESITEIGEFAFNFVGHGKTGGEFWGVHVGSRCVFHLHVNNAHEIETIYLRQKNYPYYSPTEKDHFFFFEDRLYHVAPARVDPLAEMIILYFSRMTKKLKPEIRTIQREFGASLNKFDSILKKKLEEKKKPVPSAVGAYSGPITPSLSTEQVTVTSSYTPPSQAAAGKAAAHAKPQPEAAPAPQVIIGKPAATQSSKPPLASTPASAPSQGAASTSAAAPPADPDSPPASATAATPSLSAAESSPAAAVPAAPCDAGGDQKDLKELQRERMRERRRRLGLPDDIPI